jgi:hypothetical protein
MDKKVAKVVETEFKVWLAWRGELSRLVGPVEWQGGGFLLKPQAGDHWLQWTLCTQASKPSLQEIQRPSVSASPHFSPVGSKSQFTTSPSVCSSALQPFQKCLKDPRLPPT